MAVTGRRGVGIPTILMHDGEGCIVTVELKTGVTYRGYLEDSEDNFNMYLKDSTKTMPDGKTSRVDVVYIRGSQIVMVMLPGMLKNAPMFKRVKMWKKHRGSVQVGLGEGGVARGQAAAIIRKAAARRDQVGPPAAGGMGGPMMGR